MEGFHAQNHDALLILFFLFPHHILSKQYFLPPIKETFHRQILVLSRASAQKNAGYCKKHTSFVQILSCDLLKTTFIYHILLQDSFPYLVTAFDTLFCPR